MNKIKIFLAAPISAFKDELEYKTNRESLLRLIDKLSVEFHVYSEISNIGSFDLYDEPGDSAIKDFNEISESDVFIIYHPLNIQTSTLIELGYAVAKEKRIIMIAEPDTLPFLAWGLMKFSSNVKMIPTSELGDSEIDQIVAAIKEVVSRGN